MTIFVHGSEFNDNFDTFFVLGSVGVGGSGRFRVDDRQSRTGYGLIPLVLTTNEGGESLLLGRVGIVWLDGCFLLFWLGVWDR